MPDPSTLEYAEHDHIAVLTLNDPKTRNALSGEPLFAAFESVVARVNADINVRAVILTGTGPAFCSGGNVREMRDKTGMFAGSPDELARQDRDGIQRIPRALYALEAPLIAAVNGPAVGAGSDLACMCDFRIASDRATFAQSFVKLGIVAGDGGAWFLPRIIGWSRAAEMAFTGDTIDAATALAWGLVSAVVPPDQLMPEARRMAARISANPPRAVRWMKRLMREADEGGRLDAVLESSVRYQALAHQTADHREALAALFEKRPARFFGR